MIALYYLKSKEGEIPLSYPTLTEYNMDLYDNAIFLFCGGKSDRFKALYWDGDGFILLYKRINDGKLKWPRKSEEIMKLSNQQLRWLLEGLSIIQQNKKKKGVKTTF